MSTEERPDSLAAQAASWVPPWERQQPPDRAYQAAAMAAAGEPEAASEPETDGEPDAVPPELPPLPGEVDEVAAVDAPVDVPDEDASDPTDVGVAPEMPLPAPVEDAGEQALEDERDPFVDVPLPDGDDAGEVFDAAADDDVRDDELAMPFTEEMPYVPVQGRGSQGPPTEVGEEDARTRSDSDLPALGDRELRAALEAILLVVDEPVAEMQLAQIMEQPTERVAAMLEDISARYTAAGHGFDLRRAAGGWRLYTRPEYAPYVERFVLDGQSVRLTQAALETLAVVAYKQPVTRSRISAIRGVNCDGVMRTLVTRGLIEECGTEGDTGAYLYRTTPLFLEKLGLNSVNELPPLAPFLPDDVEEVLDASG